MDKNNAVFAIKEELKKRNLTYKELSNLSGVPLDTLNNFFRGKTKNPRIDTMRAIEDALGLTPHVEVSVDYLLGRTNNPKEIYHPNNEIISDKIITMPIIGSISAGYNGQAIEEVLDETSVFKMSFRGYSPDECFLLKVNGDSMYPDFHDKDIVLVHRQTSVDSGAIAVIMYNGDDATLKKIVYEQNENWLDLVPRNPEYKTKRIKNDELLECRVLGKVICLVHRDYF